MAAEALSSLPMPRLTKGLTGIFGVALLLRFLYPFFYNPHNELWSDMKRHWENGGVLFHPGYVNGVDAKTYQVWMFLLRIIAGDNSSTSMTLYTQSVIALVTGLLCAAMAWFWYRALREICDKHIALGMSIVIALHPSLFLVYRYFLNETMALAFGGLAMWMTFRAFRKKTPLSCNVAVICWLLAGFSKQIMLPMMLIALVWLILAQRKKLDALLQAAAISLLFIIPAGLHSMAGTHIFAPFGYSGREAINHNSGYTTYAVRLFDENGGQWGYNWSSPSFYIEALHPFTAYKSYRKEGIYNVAPINIAHGSTDWSREIALSAQNHSFSDELGDLEDNFVYLFFAPSWPDSDLHSDNILMRLDFHARWTWVFLFMSLLLLAPFCRLPQQKMLLVSMAYAVTLMMLVQQIGVMEGRYRKPLEPFLIVAAYFVLESFLRRSQATYAVTPWAFIYHFCLPPPVQKWISGSRQKAAGAGPSAP